MRLIDADDLLKRYDAEHKGPPGRARQLIEEAPTIEKRNKGKWIYDAWPSEFDGLFYSFYCSECGELIPGDKKMNYCPNCGAMMKGEKHDMG